MNRPILLTTFVLVAGLTAGCRPTDGESAGGPNYIASANQRGSKAKMELKETTSATHDYTYAQKAEFIDQRRRDLLSVQKELDCLSAKAARVGGAADTEGKTELDAARLNWSHAKKQLEMAERATESSWNDVTIGFAQANDELKGSLERIRRWLSDKIAL